MAKYDVTCGYCKKKGEVEQSYMDTSPIKCPHCGKTGRIVKNINKPMTIIYRSNGFTKRVKKDE